MPLLPWGGRLVVAFENFLENSDALRQRYIMPTALSSWPVAVTSSVLSIYSLLVSYTRLSRMTTLMLLPLANFLVFVIVRFVKGLPPTLRGVRTVGAPELPGAYRGKRFQLVAMPINHFGERLRWCLDLLGVAYEEQTVGGLLSVFFRGRSVPWLVDRQSCSVIGNSDEALMYLAAVHVPTLCGSTAGKARVLLQRDAVTMAWEAKLNALGHAVQGWGYYYVLGQAPSVLCLTAWGAYEPLVPLLHRTVLRWGCSAFKAMMWEAFKESDLSMLQRRQRVISDLLDEVDVALTSHKYILGEEPSYVDITFCSLLAPLMGSSVCFRSERSFYANGRFASFAGLFDTHRDKFPAELVKFESELLARPAGKFIQQMYTEMRSDTF